MCLPVLDQTSTKEVFRGISGESGLMIPISFTFLRSLVIDGTYLRGTHLTGNGLTILTNYWHFSAKSGLMTQLFF